MNLHEYQAKEILAKRGVPIPRGSVCYDPLEAQIAARELKTEKVVLKAQAHTGGRGKAGGVALVSAEGDIRTKASEILGRQLVTYQTGPEGKPVSALLVEEVLPIDREMYLGAVLDRTSGKVTIMASSEGGVEIEKLARESPEKIITIAVDPLRGLTPFQARLLAYKLSDNKIHAQQIAKTVSAVYDVFIKYDCTLAEINPLIVSGDKVLALDAKINLDENALFRHPELESMRDRSQEDLLELSARKDGLSYIKLTGDIGCIVNGAGLAMATLDLIALHGGSPANFLDVGGGASEQGVADAMNILLDDRRVKVVFINIFGGILRCDVLARGVIKALNARGVALPIVARIEGTNIEEGRELFEQSGLPIEMIPSLDEAARLVVAKAKSL
ncbi:ADP-forming succinate--CoA ligase subunit beta [Desulfomonile tiedjei]|uniref:Succinate--CoA ligase [ADP-forming] subunit beta n=1 Tax=Desulfomonile tiedjei (strain ATCC 49306 / DSM 6799 / DCB-1) TaxID=706587 RepID=I4CAU5_DESTA|nr:ADP-forming succinate--CoA ligase subunit beta [Desulfomonile tiedjei]AFM26686.1 succinyl-CoA synthetase (ADP-forming) beta subunit [Desulfomonile tiedjei DSM 6799]